MEFLSFGLVSSVAIAIILIVILTKAVKFVPQNRAFVVERFGKYIRTLEAGLNFLNPFFDRVAYNRTLKEQAFDVPSQAAITRDNISLIVDGVLYLKVLDPVKASYGVDDYVYAVTQLAQTTMRSEIGKIELDKTFEEREALNNNIVSQINEAAGPWGVMVLRYEIKDIEPPRTAEAEKAEQILNAEGEANAIIAVAEAKAEALNKVGAAANTEDGQKAVQLDLAEQAISAKEAIARDSSVVLLSDSQTNASNVVAEAMTIVNRLNEVQGKTDGTA